MSTKSKEAWAREGFATLRPTFLDKKIWGGIRKPQLKFPNGNQQSQILGIPSKPWEPLELLPKRRPLFPLELTKFWRETPKWMRQTLLFVIGMNLYLAILWAIYSTLPAIVGQ